MLMTLATAAMLVPGAVLVGDGATPLFRVHSDTRTLRPGDLFVALRGEHFDGHRFLGAARAGGAAAAIAEEGLAEAALPGLVVADTLAALQQLARGWRARFALALAAITGSNGKTTVTQMVGAILREWLGDAALVTSGNLNNHIGLPLTLLRLNAAHRAAVVEIGMNHPGEVAALAAIAAPTVALVNNAQREHQEFMAGVEAVARENGAVIDALGADGIAVFPADDPFAAMWRQRSGARRCMAFALDGQADVVGRARWSLDHWQIALHTPAGAGDTTLVMPGRHNAKNAVAAAAAGLALGVPLHAVLQGLRGFVPVAGRSALRRFERAGRAVTLVDDSYNANPDSVLAAIELLASLPAPRWLVLGDMGEVGAQGPAFHAEVGAAARERGIEHLWTAGTLAADAARAFGPAARHFASRDGLIAALHNAPAAASVLIKGSRFMAMEQVVESFAGVADAA
jgi:UDP-N-acetylmuramoyl-tripeptide--D-alanyl-D-alanine ligase